MKRNSFVSALGVAFAATLSVGFVNVTPRVIYGEDNRLDVYQVQREDVKEVTESTVALIPNSALKIQSNGFIQLKTSQYGGSLNLCSNEPYYDQPTAANCSGSLVGADLIATAGHCITSTTCGKYSFIFGFKMRSEHVPQDMIPASDVYSCKEIVAREYTTGADYALVRLDRAVLGRRVLSLQKDPVRSGDEIYVVGHPSGLPTKVADGGKVRTQMNGYFVTNLDTYGGNSGSAVFNAQTNEVVGILVRGANDFVYDRQNQCTKSNVCPEDGCRGEDVTNISYISDALKK